MLLLKISAFNVSFKAITFAYVCWFTLGVTIPFLPLIVLTISQALLLFFFSAIPSAFWVQDYVLPQQRSAWYSYQDIFRILSAWVLVPLRRVGTKSQPWFPLTETRSMSLALPLQFIRIGAWHRIYPHRTSTINILSRPLHQHRYPLIRIWGGVVTARVLPFLQQGTHLLTNLTLQQYYLNHVNL